MIDTITLPRSVVEQALEALETGIQYDYHGNPYSDNDAARCGAYDALRAALEQPQVEQEPIAWANINKQGDITHTSNKKMAWAKTPLYTHPQPPRQPLTDEQIMQAVRHLYQSDYAAGMGFLDDADVARAIEAAHGIKEQE